MIKIHFVIAKTNYVKKVKLNNDITKLLHGLKN